MPRRTGCTARIAWGALCPDGVLPEGMPRWHHCTRERGHEGAHRAIWRDRVVTWDPRVGGVRQGAGRPRLAAEEARSERVVVRVRGEELRALESAAGNEGVGPWLRGVGLRAARRHPTSTNPAK